MTPLLVFIAHASEDKEAAARPLAEELRRRGLGVWYDEFVLRVGAGLRREIDRGLASCDAGVVILSKHFFEKEWPQRELDGLTTREVAAKRNILLPVWHGVTTEDVNRYSPLLAGRVAVSTGTGIFEVANQIIAALEDGRHENLQTGPRVVSDHAGVLTVLKPQSCPICGGELLIRVDSGSESYATTCASCGFNIRDLLV